MRLSKLKRFTKKLLKELGTNALIITVGFSAFWLLLWILGGIALACGMAGANPLFGSIRLGAGGAIFSLLGLLSLFLFMLSAPIAWLCKLWKDS